MQEDMPVTRANALKKRKRRQGKLTKAAMINLQNRDKKGLTVIENPEDLSQCPSFEFCVDLLEETGLSFEGVYPVWNESRNDLSFPYSVFFYK